MILYNLACLSVLAASLPHHIISSTLSPSSLNASYLMVPKSGTVSLKVPSVVSYSTASPLSHLWSVQDTLSPPSPFPRVPPTLLDALFPCRPSERCSAEYSERCSSLKFERCSDSSCIDRCSLFFATRYLVPVTTVPNFCTGNTTARSVVSFVRGRSKRKVVHPLRNWRRAPCRSLSARCHALMMRWLLQVQGFRRENVARRCRTIGLYLKRNAMYRHDFPVAVEAAYLGPMLAITKQYGCGIHRALGAVEDGLSLPKGWPDPTFVLTLASIARATEVLCPLSLSACFSLCLFDRFEPAVAIPYAVPKPLGGGVRKFSFPLESVEPYVTNGHHNLRPDVVLKFVDHTDSLGMSVYDVSKGYVHAQLPLRDVVEHVSVAASRKIARAHGIIPGPALLKEEVPELFQNHSCVSCTLYYTIFSVVDVGNKKGVYNQNRRAIYREKKELSDISSADLPVVLLEEDAKKKAPTKFPPPPATSDLTRSIIKSFCMDTSVRSIEEAGCAVCGLLRPRKLLRPLKSIKGHLGVLNVPGVTRIERKSSREKIREYKGPVLDYKCRSVCETCRISVLQGLMPANALANGMWIGEVPEVLKDLRFVEQLLVSRVRRSCCYARVSASGLNKMKAHVIAFEAPVAKVYDMLPPPVEDLDDILAILFTGPCKPTEADLQRTPLLVRRNAVMRALEWLKLNHSDYADVGISYSNLSRYPEDQPPVYIVYRESLSTASTVNPSVFEAPEAEEGAAEGECPFVVHGLTGDQLSTKSIEELKGIALKHWRSNGKALGVGHSEKPKSSFNDPSLYTQMFPWLFPYGLGGIGASGTSAKTHKKNLLMYHDKRFQTDPGFPFVAFSHEQVRAASSGGYLAVEKKNFDEIADRLLTADQSVLESIATRMSRGETVKPETEQERQCFQVVNDLDVVSGGVDGSAVTKKHMRNEIWSLVINKGAPFWYITLSPADVKHPICLYFADSGVEFRPEIGRTADDAFRLIARNPVAGARFFNLMINAFIKHVLGVGTNRSGLYGDTSAYYGTVEQQGRLTLHFHMLLWISGGLTPDDARQKIMDTESEFQRELVEYLEEAHRGDFLTGTLEQVSADVDTASKLPEYRNPTQTMPEPPPEPCPSRCDDCKPCSLLSSWWIRFRKTVDDLLFKSNVHTCSSTLNKDGTQKRNKEYKGCLDNKWGTCKARFPRPLFLQTEVDPATGALNMKKAESWLNTFTSALTYLFRCNTDVTSLRSGTAIKGVLLYVTKYVTKPTLKTFVSFDAVRSIFQKNTVILGSTLPRQEKARALMTKVVNHLSAKAEMGSPMISMYLLNHPDHYTDHKFATLHWPSFVREVRVSSDEKNLSGSGIGSDKIPIVKKRGRVVGLSSVFDYLYRSPELERMTLYEWASRCERVKIGSEAAKSSASFRAKDPRSSSVTLRFQAGHPLADSHATVCHPPFYKMVPNFVGGTLPRRDQGDREYYCATMLTLFKPWRSGADLKLEGASWDQSFGNQSFSDAQLTLMKNMNIRYECLDARDDFHAQLKKGSFVFSPGGADEDLMADLDHQDWIEDARDMNPEEEADEYACTIGRREENRRATIASMARIMDSVGWSEPVFGMLPKSLNLTPGKFCEPMAGSQWKALVAQERSNILEERAKNLRITVPLKNTTDPNKVEVLDRSFLERRFKSAEWENTIAGLASDFQLNPDQERAFRIVANHAAVPGAEPLRMYMGGMGGTGKTQVLRSLISYFASRGEAHRLVVVAPTGTAASLLGGSTYHYLLGINDMTDLSKIQLAQVKSRLTGVDYVFFDEVSMLSCRDLYRIAARLSQISGVTDEPFGGMNMLFAGDFAQLPPVIGHEHASLYSRTAGSDGSTLKDQESAIGKSVWHQITTVVILRQNMRQKERSKEDTALRQALENMRYKACTPADIAFLRGRVSSDLPGRPNICDANFRNVSVITALNMHKDAINSAGTRRFAMESGQELTDFFSEDKPVVGDGETDKVRSVKSLKAKFKTELPDSVQKQLWEQPPCSTNKHIAGKLSLCVGLPVIIRHNAATELCITNGQEGVVYGWQSCTGSKGQRMLDTLFVKLSNPPQPVNLPGLPQDVVPLVRSSVSLSCQLPDDTSVAVSRSQVEVLVNYAMTDYASQGKTRPDNVVDLNNCRSHQSYYTALSRSASAAGTLILQGFDPTKIAGKASGALRQEFRELELLDEITKLRYLGKLPAGMHDANRRNTLLASYRELKGESYMPPSLHRAIRWNKGDPFLSASAEDVSWRIVEKADSKIIKDAGKQLDQTRTEFVPARGASSCRVPLTKRKIETSDNSSPNKRQKTSVHNQNFRDVDTEGDAPRGTQWLNNSCAYDAVVTIFHGIWSDDVSSRSREFEELNPANLGVLARGFQRTGLDGRLEDVRDDLRVRLRQGCPEAFPDGEYTSVHAVVDQLLLSRRPVTESSTICRAGHRARRAAASSASCHILLIDRGGPSLQDHVDRLQVTSASNCTSCSLHLIRVFRFVSAPVLLAFDVSKVTPVLDLTISLLLDNVRHTYKLRGVIYYGSHHFTCRIVSASAEVWFHDGVMTGSRLVRESADVNMAICGARVATLAIYAKDA